MAAGCNGQFYAPDPDIDQHPRLEQREDGSFVCNPEVRPSASALHRLTAVQYRNTLADLFGPAEGFAVDVVAADSLEWLPADDTHENRYSRQDGRLLPEHAKAYFDVADDLAEAVSADSEARRALVGDCADDATLTSACVTSFLNGFAMRAFRRPLAQAEKDRLRALDDGTRSGPELLYALFFTVLAGPQLVYQFELDGEPIDDDNFIWLDGYALASRLSYHFWQTLPDDELFAAAADGSLMTDAGYAAQVDRIVEDGRTEQAVATFYREWLRYAQISSFSATAVFEAFAAGEEIHSAGADHAVAMHDELDALFRHYTWDVDGSFGDVLMSNLSFTQSPYLARLYGVEPWDGVGDYPQFPAGTRAGLLTRAALLVSGRHTTNPVSRGALIRKVLLCEELHPPDPATLPPGSLDTPEFRPDMTTRERYATKTANEPCATCHAQLNPLGFIMERYDSLGRTRTEERVFDELTGELIAELPVDTTAVPYVVAGDDTEISTPIALMQKLAESGWVEACFARNYFRFTHARAETGNDACVLEGVRAALAGAGTSGAAPGTLKDALRAIALDPSFRIHVVPVVESGN